MSLRSRLALSFAAVGAVVAALVGVLSYQAAADRVTAEIDRTLRSATVALADDRARALALSEAVAHGPDLFPGPDRPGPGDEPEWQVTVQSVAPDGTPTHLGGPPVALPVPAAARVLAASGAPGDSYTTEVVVGRATHRQLTTALGGGRGALQVAVAVDQTHHVLGGMAREIAGAGLAVVLAAAVAGRLLAGRITRRLERLARVAAEVSADGRGEGHTDVRSYGGVLVDGGGRDEVGLLTRAFGRMLTRLADARAAQERLVQDAAHELRTPLTSLRANAGVLHRITELAPDARERLLYDIEGETGELVHLVDDLVALALVGAAGDEAAEPVELAEVARRAARRVHRRTGRLVLLDADGSVVHGRRRALERAVGNLLENAAKFDPDGADPVELRVHRGTLTVSDRGPGIPAADAPHVFDRFYRAATARALPGSGLGLAIVRDVAAAHGGTAFAVPRPGGGTTIGFTVATVDDRP
ncbi:integral membrane sensor signal transduction histidine kinase [Actinobacteria bacterium OK074]|nr:integral membrane sensor signal transduction histidine kinase [Actinobacteria bacterium OK074]